MAVPVPPPDTPSRAAAGGPAPARRQALLSRRSGPLHRQGWTGAAIAQHLGLSLRTCSAISDADRHFPGRNNGRGHSVLNPYNGYLLEHWKPAAAPPGSCFRASSSRATAGSYAPVARLCPPLRQAQGLHPGQPPARAACPRVAEPLCPPLTPRRSRLARDAAAGGSVRGRGRQQLRAAPRPAAGGSRGRRPRAGLSPPRAPAAA